METVEASAEGGAVAGADRGAGDVAAGVESTGDWVWPGGGASTGPDAGAVLGVPSANQEGSGATEAEDGRIGAGGVAAATAGGAEVRPTGIEVLAADGAAVALGGPAALVVEPGASAGPIGTDALAAGGATVVPGGRVAIAVEVGAGAGRSGAGAEAAGDVTLGLGGLTAGAET